MNFGWAPWGSRRGMWGLLFISVVLGIVLAGFGIVIKAWFLVIVGGGAVVLMAVLAPIAHRQGKI